MRSVVAKMMKAVLGVMSGLALLLGVCANIVYAEENQPVGLSVHIGEAVVNEGDVTKVTPDSKYQFTVYQQEGTEPIAVTYKLSTEDVAYVVASSISEDGILIPSKEDAGQTLLVTATSVEDETDKVVAKVYVNYVAEKLALNKKSSSLTMKQTVQLKATVTPMKAINKQVSWKSTNTKVATVSSKGLVKAVAPGKCSIIASVKNSTVSSTCTITVKKPALNMSAKTIAKGKKFTLKVSNLPGTIKWSSNNASVATVSKGVVTTKKTGSATITASCGKYKVSCKVKVTNPSIVNSSNAAVEGIYVTAGFNRLLKIKGSSSKVTWKTSNGKIATVSKGVVTGKKTGSCIVSAVVDGKTIKCKVTVKSNVFSAHPTKNGRYLRKGKIHLSNASLYYSKGKLIYKCYAVNSTAFKKVERFNNITISIYANNKLIAKQTYKNIKLNLSKYKSKALTFTFAKKNVKGKADLRISSIKVQYSYGFQYIN